MQEEALRPNQDGNWLLLVSSTLAVMGFICRNICQIMAYFRIHFLFTNVNLVF
jgi:hypothetical protein